jgi:hypothetical protein
MRTRFVISTLGILAGLLLLAWILRSKEPSSTSVPPARGQVLVPSNPAPQSGGLPDAISNALKSGEERYLAQAIRPIEFYGKVVDENSQPVAEADVEFSQTYTSPPVRTRSDTNGLFSLSGVSGRYLNVAVAKRGFYRSKGDRTSFDFSEALAVEAHRPNPADPVIFHLRTKTSGAELITSRYGVSPELEFSGPRDGSAARVDFFNRKVGAEGQMEVSAFKPPRGQTGGEWWFRLSIPDGGFVSEQEEFPFLAPESGYQPAIEFHFRAGETNWTDTIKNSYFIKFGSPPKYGRIDLETGMYMGVSLGFAINPDGSRNLEPKEPVPPKREVPPGVTEVVPGGSP